MSRAGAVQLQTRPPAGVSQPAGPDLDSALARAGADFFSALCVDWEGRLRGKQLAVEKAAAAVGDGVAMTTAIFATDAAEQPMAQGVFQDPARGYRDGRLVFPDRAIYQDPLMTSGSRVVLLGQFGDVHAEVCPRALLGAEAARLADAGLAEGCACEIEAHILAETPESLVARPPAALRSAPGFGRMYSREEQVLAAPTYEAIARHGRAMGLAIAAMHGEFRGMLELSFRPTPACRAADQLVLLKSLLKVIARQQGYLASFMAQLSDAHESAGCHLNISLTRGAGEMFALETDGARARPLLQHFLGGLQAHLPALFLLFAPNLNSWKRLAGAAFVPRTNSWGVDNKTCAYRVVAPNAKETRIEVRLPGADTNPYLTLLAVLGAGRLGVRDRLLPSAPVIGDAANPGAPQGVPFPQDFREAIARFREAAVARALLGAPFVEAYARSREWQWERYCRTVTDWEVRQFAESV